MCSRRPICANCKFINIIRTTCRFFELPVAAHLLTAFRRHDGHRLVDVIQVRQQDADARATIDVLGSGACVKNQKDLLQIKLRTI